MTFEELIERVGWGEEFLFKYENEKYWISQNTDGRYLTRVSDGFTQSYKTTEELIENGRINGKSLEELWEFISDQL